jgi:hypothetical protein
VLVIAVTIAINPHNCDCHGNYECHVFVIAKTVAASTRDSVRPRSDDRCAIVIVLTVARDPCDCVSHDHYDCLVILFAMTVAVNPPNCDCHDICDCRAFVIALTIALNQRVVFVMTITSAM